MSLAYLGLGSNQGSRREHLARAVRALGSLPGCRLVAVSDLYETAYQGPGRQEHYLNACLALETELSPHELLQRGQQLEREAGRPAGSHMLPRPLDVDLLLLDQRRVEEEDLQIPHPRLTQRRFVLEPLCDLDPELVIPGETRPVRVLARSQELRRQPVHHRASGAWWREASA